MRFENPVTIADDVSDETVAMIKEDRETYLGADVRIVQTENMLTQQLHRTFSAQSGKSMPRNTTNAKTTDIKLPTK